MPVPTNTDGAFFVHSTCTTRIAPYVHPRLDSFSNCAGISRSTCTFDVHINTKLLFCLNVKKIGIARPKRMLDVHFIHNVRHRLANVFFMLETTCFFFSDFFFIKSMTTYKIKSCKKVTRMCCCTWRSQQILSRTMYLKRYTRVPLFLVLCIYLLNYIWNISESTANGLIFSQTDMHWASSEAIPM